MRFSPGKQFKSLQTNLPFFRNICLFSYDLGNIQSCLLFLSFLLFLVLLFSPLIESPSAHLEMGFSLADMRWLLARLSYAYRKDRFLRESNGMWMSSLLMMGKGRRLGSRCKGLRMDGLVADALRLWRWMRFGHSFLVLSQFVCLLFRNRLFYRLKKLLVFHSLLFLCSHCSILRE